MVVLLTVPARIGDQPRRGRDRAAGRSVELTQPSVRLVSLVIELTLYCVLVGSLPKIR